MVADLITRAREGHIALMQGDVGRYRSLILLDERFTLMSPFGSYSSRGNSYTEDDWVQIGQFFRNGRDSTFEPVEVYRGVDVIVLAAIEHSNVEVGGSPAQPWTLRVTLVFRRHGNQWRLAHRHADPLGQSIGLERSAEIGRWPAQMAR
ncbi:MAG: nuclear transport factor 2 family protein [Burkholderiaceae bacterium]